MRANAAPPRVQLFRAILSNLQGSEIRVLFWEDMATRFENSIMRMIVEIRRPRVVAANLAFRDRHQTLLPIELSISNGNNTEIITLGPMPEDHVPAVIPAESVEIGNVAAAEGRVISKFMFFSTLSLFSFHNINRY